MSFCDQCGEKIAPAARFCGTCGSPRSSDIDVPSPPVHAGPLASSVAHDAETTSLGSATRKPSKARWLIPGTLGFSVLLALARTIGQDGPKFLSQETGQSDLSRLSSVTYDPTVKIGIDVQPINPTNAALLGLQPGVGWYVSTVYNSYPASTAGIQTGDFIVSADGRTLYSSTVGDPLAEAKAGKLGGSKIRIDGYRLLKNGYGEVVYRQAMSWSVSLP